ncbi:hypothetical protein SK128_017166 [Halocaridina rubra]|uniref:G-protein coupled receptors family 1 profile domain-containing protein n=1 Tax=Halocaridina rubra TaxID=373956 RepID=A0AAN8XGJ8_HALRR
MVTSNPFLICGPGDCTSQAAALTAMSYIHHNENQNTLPENIEKTIHNVLQDTTINYLSSTVNSATSTISTSYNNVSSSGSHPTGSSVDTLLPDVSFPAYMKGVYTAWGLLLLLVGLVGNLMVPLVVAKDRELRVATTSVFIVNLVVADLLVLIICMPTLLSELFAPPSIWILPESMCKFVPYVEFTVAHASLLTIMAISIERYRVICHPLTAAANCSRARALCACILVWVIATVFVVSATVLLFFLPLLVLIVLYWRICKQLLLEDKQLCNDKPNPNLQARKQVSSQTLNLLSCLR